MIYKLKFTDKNEADKAVKGLQNVIRLGVMVDTQGTYDDEGNEITPPTYLEGYHVDVVSRDEDLDFGDNRVFPTDERHKIFEI